MATRTWNNGILSSMSKETGINMAILTEINENLEEQERQQQKTLDTFEERINNGDNLTPAEYHNYTILRIITDAAINDKTLSAGKKENMIQKNTTVSKERIDELDRIHKDDLESNIINYNNYIKPNILTSNNINPNNLTSNIKHNVVQPNIVNTGCVGASCAISGGKYNTRNRKSKAKKSKTRKSKTYKTKKSKTYKGRR